MKSVVMHRTGGPEVLQPDRMAEPVPGAGQSRQDPVIHPPHKESA